jgi:hypothetical protein
MQGVRGWTEYHQISYRDVKLELVCYESTATAIETTLTVPECEDEYFSPSISNLFIALKPSHTFPALLLFYSAPTFLSYMHGNVR